MTEIALSVLDQSTIKSGHTPAEAVAETIALAQHVDRLGYARYWLAEHHNSDAHAGTCPEILAGRLAAATPRIRVGTAGIMLSHYAPLKIAEQFRMLETLFPGRIDLGMGRAPGSDGMTAMALNRAGFSGEDFPAQVQDVLSWLAGTPPAGHPFAQIKAQPEGATEPEVWILGSSGFGAQVGAYFGLRYAFAEFITDEGGPTAMEIYRSRFRPSRYLSAPHGAVACFALCADTEEEALRLASSRFLWRLRRDMGEFGPLPSVEEAAAYPYTPIERQRLERYRARHIVGAPEQVKARIEALAKDFGVQEVAILTAVHDPAARQRSYTLIGEAFGLRAGAAEKTAAE
ncbi:MAG: LLM class flavin-dependent oxidoreductase [Alphaproteobacteria bacterium]|nr:LLM class flavin-dependent oxidoreductase [Alphaproteobacteria bacterium]